MVVNPDSDDPPVFQMLPLCFYLPLSEGAPLQPSTQELQLAMDRALNIVGLQDCTCPKFRQDDPYDDDPKHPFVSGTSLSFVLFARRDFNLTVFFCPFNTFFP